MKINAEDVHSAGLVTVCASFKKSGQAPESRSYEGAFLKTLADCMGQPLLPESVCVFKASDGFSVAITGEEALEACFIAVSEAGKPLTLEDGQPYCMMLMTEDTTSQRWCRYLDEIEIRE